MSKFRKLILLLGFIVIPVVASLVTFLGLNAAGVIISDTTPLVYTIETASKAYDGTPLKATSAILTEGELKAGHSAQFSFSGEITEVGQAKSDVFIKIVDEDNVDVTEQYSIKVNKGNLEVTKQQISIILDDCEMEYNGGELVCDNYQLISGYLATGHTIVPTTKDAILVNVNDRLPDASSFVPVIYDNNGVDKSYNYDITFTIGQNVKITPRELVIKPSDIEFTYDGKSHEFNSYEIVSGSLVKGHYVEAIYEDENGIIETPYIDALEKTMEVAFNSVRILTKQNGVEVDVTSNYALNYSETGSITINKAQIEIELNDVKALYTGKAFGSEEGFNASKLFTLVENSDLIILNNASAKIKPNLSGLSDVIEEGTYLYYLQTADSDDDYYISLEVYDSLDIDITDNFNFILLSGNPGEILISKIEVTIDMPNFEQYYSDSDFKLEENFQLDKDVILSDGTKVKVEFDESKISYVELDDGKHPNKVGTYHYTVPITKILKYEINEDTLEEELTTKTIHEDNMIINYTGGIVTIKAIDVVIDLKDFDDIDYNGAKFYQYITLKLEEKFWYDGFEIKDDSATIYTKDEYKAILLSSASLTNPSAFIILPRGLDNINMTDVGTYQYYLEGVDKPYTIGFDVYKVNVNNLTSLDLTTLTDKYTENFNFSLKYNEPGNITINKKDVYITLNDVEKLCDGKTLDEYLIEEYNKDGKNPYYNDLLISSETELVETKISTLVSSKLYISNYDKIKDLKEEEIYQYYLADKSQDYYIEVGVLSINLEDLKDLTPADLLLSAEQRFAKYGKDVSANYNIILQNGQTCANVKIVRPTITVTLASMEKTYDGSQFNINKNESYTYEGLPEGYSIEMTNWSLATTTMINAGEYTNTGTFIIKRDNKTIDSSYYNLVIVDGTITINKANLEVTLNELEDVTYNNKSLTQIYQNNNQWLTYTAPTGFNVNVDIKKLDQKDAGTYEYTVNGDGQYDIELKIYRNGTDVTNNFNVIADYASVTIKPIEVLVELKSLDKIYDTKSIVDGYEQEDLNELVIEVIEKDAKSVLLSGMSIKVTDASTLKEMKEAGEYQYYFNDETKEFYILATVIEKVVEGRQEKEVDQGNNYKFIVKFDKPGKATINKKTVYVTLKDLEKLYNDKTVDAYLDDKYGDKGKNKHYYDSLIESVTLTDSRLHVVPNAAIKDLELNGTYTYYLADKSQEYYIELAVEYLDPELLTDADKTLTENQKYENYGVDTTNNYEFKLAKGQKSATINIVKPTITFTFVSGEKDYDGTKYDITWNTSYDIEGKPDAYTTTIDTTKWSLYGNQLINAELYINEIPETAITIKDENNKIVDSEYYDLVINPGVITINKIDLKVEFISNTTTFNGYEQPINENSSYTHSGLPGGHSISLTNWSLKNTKIIEANEYKNTVNSVSDIQVKYNGKDVTANFNIEYTEGLIIINKLDIELTLKDVQGYVYDGKSLTDQKHYFSDTHWVQVKEQIPGFVPEFDISALKQSNAGTYNYTVNGDGEYDIVLTMKKGGVDYTSNFNIIVGSASVTIKPIEVVVELKSLDKIYDTKSIIDGYSQEDLNELVIEVIEKDAKSVLLSGMSIKVTDASTLKEIKNVGEYEYFLNDKTKEFYILATVVEQDGTTNDNYRFVVKYDKTGKITINKKTVYVTLNDFEKLYNEKTFDTYLKDTYGSNGTNPNYFNELISYSEIPDNSRVMVSNYDTIKALELNGTYTYYLADKSQEYYIELAVEYLDPELLTDADKTLTENQKYEQYGVDATENYEIKLAKGQESATINIVKPEIIVTFVSDEKTYDGLQFNINKNDSYTHKGLPEGYSLEMTNWSLNMQTDFSVGEYEHTGTFTVKYDNKTVDSTYYKLVIVSGTLTITKADFVVSLKELNDITYNDKTLIDVYNSESYWLSYIAPTGFEVSVDLDSLKQSNAGTYNYTVNGDGEYDIELTIYRNGTDVTNNFNVIADYASITIKPIEVVVELKSLDKIYDTKSIIDGYSQEELNELVIEVIEKDAKSVLLSGMSIKVTDASTLKEIKNAGEYEYFLNDKTKEFYILATVVEQDGTTNDNYRFVVKYDKTGKITINKKTVYVTLNDFEKLYNEKTFDTYLNDTYGSNGTNPNYFNELISYSAIPDNSRVMVSNYDTIKALELNGTYTYYLADKSQEYYIELAVEYLDPELLTDADKTLTDNQKYEKYGVDATENYEIKLAKGQESATINIVKPEIIVTFVSDEKTYDGLRFNINKNDSYTHKELPEGYSLEMTNWELESDIMINAGEYTNTGTFNIKCGGDIVPSEYYDLRVIDGTITINKADLEVSFKDIIKDFNGNEQTIAESESYEAELPNGHSISLTNWSLKDIKIIEAKEYKNTVSSVSDIQVKYNGNNVTDNFNVTIVKDGTIAINKATVEITLKEGLSKTYDEKSFEIDPEQVDKVLTHNATGFNVSFFIDTSTFVNVGTYEIELDDIQFEIKKGDVVYTDSFNTVLSSESKSKVIFKVTPRDIVIEGNIERTYDGTAIEFTSDVFSIKDADSKIPIDKIKVDSLNVEDIIYDSDISKYTSQPASFGVGTQPLTADMIFNYDLFTLVDENGIDVTNNYKATTVKVSLTYNKKQIVIVADDISLPYVPGLDGEDYGDYYFDDLETGEYGSLSISSSLAKGDYFEVGSFSVPTIDYDDCIVEDFEELLIRNYKGDDVTDYYDYTVRYGFFNIIPYSVTITFGSYEFIYGDDDGINDLINSQADDLIISNSASEEYLSAVIDELALELDFPDHLEDAGTYSYTAKIDEDFAKYYNVVIVPGTITIKKQDVNVVLKQFTSTYDPDNGFDFPSSGYIISNLPDGISESDFEPVLEENMTDVGTYSYTVSYDGDNKNYNFIISSSTVIITKQDVYVALKSFNETYDPNTPFTVPDDKNEYIIYESISDLEYAVVANDMTNAGTYSYTITFASDENYKNYNLVIIQQGTVIIEKVTIRVILADLVVEYGEGINESDAILYSSDNSISLEVVSPDINGIGTYTYTVKFANDEDYKNYNLEVIKSGTITVVNYELD